MTDQPARSAMGLTCNIDRRGRRVRMVFGVATLLAGAAGLIAALLAGWGTLAFIGAGFLLLAGAFGVFEALNGWCAVRALGVRTPV